MQIFGGSNFLVISRYSLCIYVSPHCIKHVNNYLQLFLTFSLSGASNYKDKIKQIFKKRCFIYHLLIFPLYLLLPFHVSGHELVKCTRVDLWLNLQWIYSPAPPSTVTKSTTGWIRSCVGWCPTEKTLLRRRDK